MGAGDALAAARWAAAADPDDPLVPALLRMAAQLAVAVITSITSSELRRLPVDGELRDVPPGLPPTAMTSGRWAECLWAATGDAASALRLARAGLDRFPDDAPAGEAQLAAAMAAWWRAEEVGPHLIAALEASDPDAASGAERDRRLDLTTPAVGVLRWLLDRDEAALGRAFADAQASFRSYWDAPSRRDSPEGVLSLPLSGLARVAGELGRPVDPQPRVVPPAVLRDVGDEITACPVCATPFGQDERSCWWCGTDLAADAPLGMTVGELLATPGRPCPACGEINRVTALRCWRCSASLPPG
jgi:hypothetical protein